MKYTVSQKNIRNIFDCNVKKNYQILIIFGMNILQTTCHWINVQFPASPKVCLCTTWGKQNQQNIAFLPNAVLLLNLNNAQKHIFLTLLTLWLTLHPTASFFNCLQQNCLNCGRIVWTQEWRRFPHSLSAVSIMFCFRLIQTSAVASWIRKHS